MAKRTPATNTRASRTQAAMSRSANRSDRSANTSERSSTDRSTRRATNTATAPPFLKADDLKDGPNAFVIGDGLSLYQRDDGTTVVFIAVTRAGARNANDETFTWGLNCKSPDRSALQQQIGRNMINWPGKRISLEPVQGTRGGWFVNLVRPDRPDDSDIPF